MPTEMKPYHIARPFGLLFLYAGTLTLSLWASYLLRFDFHPREYLDHFALIAAGMTGLKLISLLAFGQFGSLLSYFGLHDIQKIFLALLAAAGVALGFWFWQGIAYAPPRAVILTDFVLSFMAVCALRTGFRLLREGYFAETKSTGGARRLVGIIGAGDVGASLAKDLLVRRGLGMDPVVFFDDDRAKWQTSIHGVPVKGPPESLPEVLKTIQLDEVIIAMPSASGKRLREIVPLLTRCNLKFESVPSVEQLITGKVRVSQIRPVEIQDLLGREVVDLQADKIRELVHGRVVMVTGAGGTIGGELCRQIAGYGPRQLLLVERSEFLIFQIEQELQALGYGSELVPLVADIMDPSRMTGIFQHFGPKLLFHAAAHKHVPMMELQPAEAFRNNVMGTRLLADLAVAHGVDQFVLISTDKAINPTSVMGATKRIAELYLQALQPAHRGLTKFMSVRFGNVLGSSGSVIPTFKRQIALGGPVTVTHPEVTRYFMTVNEAAGLVLQSATLGQGGEIFVLDMGQPMKIVDLARQLIELSGLDPDTDIEIRFTGLRPGEKLYEELNHDTENMTPTSHAKIMRFVGAPQPLAQLQTGLESVQVAAAGQDGTKVKLAIQKIVPEYRVQPTGIAQDSVTRTALPGGSIDLHFGRNRATIPPVQSAANDIA